MSQEIGLDLPLAPVVDGEGDGVKAHWSVSQEEPSEVDPLNLVQHCVQTGYLANVIADDVQQAASDVGLTELPLILTDIGTAQLKMKKFNLKIIIFVFLP